MSKLKLGPLADEKPVRVTTELAAAIHRNLVAYAEVLSRELQQPVEPSHLIGPMLARFMAADRAFAKHRKALLTSKIAQPSELIGARPLPLEPH